MNFFVRNFTLVICLLFLSACSTYNSATGRHELIFVSTSTEVQMGNQIHAQLASQNKFISSGDEVSRLQRIGVRLARISDRQDYQYNFHLIESEDMNAFTTPGGHIYFYTGLFRKLITDDAIAAVVAHEMGHCSAKHTVKKFQSALGYDVVRNVLLNVLALKMPGAQNIASIGANGLMALATTAYSRQDEYEADRLGIKYLYLARFDLNGMIQTFEVLGQSEKGKSPPLILRTHPFVKDRIEAAKKEMDVVKGKY